MQASVSVLLCCTLGRPAVHLQPCSWYPRGWYKCLRHAGFSQCAVVLHTCVDFLRVHAISWCSSAPSALQTELVLQGLVQECWCGFSLAVGTSVGGAVGENECWWRGSALQLAQVLVARLVKTSVPQLAAVLVGEAGARVGWKASDVVEGA
jgi:hypothetical protein